LSNSIGPERDSAFFQPLNLAPEMYSPGFQSLLSNATCVGHYATERARSAMDAAFERIEAGTAQEESVVWDL
jgi:hypothetical protein